MKKIIACIIAMLSIQLNAGLLENLKFKRIKQLKLSENIDKMVFSPDGKILACYEHFKENVYLFDIQTNILLKAFNFSESILSLAFTQDGDELIIGLWNKVIKSCGIKKYYKIEGYYENNKIRPEILSFSPNEKFLAIANENKINLFNLKNEKIVFINKKSTSKFSFSPNGEILVFLIDGRTIGLWNVEKDILLRKIQLKEEKGNICSFAFSPDGKTLAVGFSTGYKLVGLFNKPTGNSVRLFNISNGKSIKTITGYFTERVVFVGFSSNGRLLITYSNGF